MLASKTVKLKTDKNFIGKRKNITTIMAAFPLPIPYGFVFQPVGAYLSHLALNMTDVKLSAETSGFGHSGQKIKN